MSNRNHPELKEKETFVGNHKGEQLPEHLKQLESARLGKIAYDIDGNVLNERHGLHPLFIGDGDYKAYDRIMMTRFNAIKGGRT